MTFITIVLLINKKNMQFKVNMGSFVSAIFAEWVKVKITNTINVDYSNVDPFKNNISRTNYTEFDLYASIQDYKTGAYSKTASDVVIKNGIRINAEMSDYNPLLKHGDIVIYRDKKYMIKDVQDKAYSNHIVYLADLNR